ncbi:MAG: hypothetical protein ACRBBW_16215 [Cellvibrionaceae bacterium]
MLDYNESTLVNTRLPDPGDQATAFEELHLKACLNAQQQKTRLRAKGSCYNCLDPLKEGALFCDSDCRDDHELRVRNK